MRFQKKNSLLEEIKNKASKCDDLVVRRLQFKNYYIDLIYIDYIVDKVMIEQRILRPLMETIDTSLLYNLENLIDYILPVSKISFTKSIDEALEKLFSGSTLIIDNKNNKILIVDSVQMAERAISSPTGESVIRGPRDAFTENFKTNISLLRKRIKNNNLKAEISTLGTRSKTTIALMYIDDIVLPDLLKELKKRINAIDIDIILESGYIEELIEDNVFSPFPQILYTERPDKVASSLLEGRIAIITDGTPIVLIVPAVFNEFFIAAEDRYGRFLYANFTRFFRLLGSILGIISPAIYIAFSSFHPAMLPTELVLTLSGGRANVPFAPIVEILAMEFTVEILREASIRLPGQLGSTLSIVGALVLGEAAVTANLVSPSLIIVVAITTVGNIAIPNYSAGTSLRILRFFYTFITAVLGLYGLVIGMIIVLVHLISLKSFGIPYLAPYAPYRAKDIKDTVFRSPIKGMLTRPRYLRPLNKIRQKIRRNK